jgi:hypothetical protein
MFRTDDLVDTIGAGANIVLVPKTLDLDLRWSLSFARSEFHSSTIPKLEDTYSQSKAYLSYHFWKHWTAKLGYVFEAFDITSAYAEVNNAGGKRFLGDFYKDYTAHILAGSLVYRF